MINLGKFTEEKFQSLKSGVQSGAKSLGKMSDQAFQGLKKGLDTYRNLPGVKQVYQTSQNLMSDPNRTQAQQGFDDALNATPMGIGGMVEKKISKELARQLSARGGKEELVSKLTGKAKVMGEMILDGLKRIKDPIDQIELEEILHNGIARGFTPESEKKALNVLRAYPTDPVAKETMDFSVEKLSKDPKVTYKRSPDNSRYAGSESKPSSPLAQEVGKVSPEMRKAIENSKTAEDFVKAMEANKSSGGKYGKGMLMPTENGSLSVADIFRGKNGDFSTGFDKLRLSNQDLGFRMKVQTEGDIKFAKNGNDFTTKIYRLVPEGGSINPGDYIFLNKSSAEKFLKDYGVKRGQTKLVTVDNVSSKDLLLPDIAHRIQNSKYKYDEFIYAPKALEGKSLTDLFHKLKGELKGKK